jgi:phosphatidylinositol glycan class S
MSPYDEPSPLIPDISPWQIEQVMRMRTKENSEEARKTLAGIVRLVKKIKEMKVEEGVRDKVLGAVERLEQVTQIPRPFWTAQKADDAARWYA